MKKSGTNNLLCDIKFYKAMLTAYAEGMTEFEFNGKIWGVDDAFMDFTKDVKNGNLIVDIRKNHQGDIEK